MKSWLILHGHALERAVKRLFAQPAVTMFSVLVIGIAITLPLGLYVVFANVRSAASHVNTEPNVNVYLALGASSQDAKEIERKLKVLGNVDRVTFISREAALEEMKGVANLADLLASLDANPLPHAFLVRPTTGEPATLETLRKEIAALPKVESIAMDFAWAQKLRRFATFAERLVLLLGMLLAAAVVFVTGNTIRLQILTQKDEIEVSQLIGATRRFIRRPFLYFGALQGLLAGVVAVLAVSIFVWWAGAEVLALTVSYGSDFSLRAPTFLQSLAVVLLSGLLGWFGAFLSVWLYLRRISNR
jgi:cell division transport system permease protein